MSDLASSADVAALADLARASGRLGIDTEFMGEGRYQTLLCLIQVAAEVDGPGSDVRIEVLDPIDQALDLAPLAAVLADPDVEIVMHAGRQDVALLRRVCRTDITNLFDTQLAAGFAGLRAQLGYEPLLHELLGVRLQKSASFTRWDARPLSAEQIDYARDDVRHILQATSELQDRLRARGRLDWAREECVALAGVTDERDPDTIFARLPRVNSLDPKLRAIARELVVWREETARAQDRPIPSVLSDAALIEVAKRRPSEMTQLEQIRGINESTLRRRGRAILEAVERGRSRPPIPVDGERPVAARRARRAGDRARRGARAHPRARGGARLRAHRRARGPAAHRARDARRQAAARRAHAAGLAARGRRRRAARATRRPPRADRRARPPRRGRRALIPRPAPPPPPPRRIVSPASGKISSDSSPAAMSAADSAPPMSPSSRPIAVAATMNGSDVA